MSSLLGQWMELDVEVAEEIRIINKQKNTDRVLRITNYCTIDQFQSFLGVFIMF